MDLGAKGRAADILVMTATPIPRSLALAQYGDMDVSVLDEKPPGRQPVETALVSSGRTDEVVEHLRRAIAEGRQAYWVCPLVGEIRGGRDDRGRGAVRAACALALGDEVVGLVHGQMPPAQKDAAMADFVAGRTRLLVATTVIEVGVNVPERLDHGDRGRPGLRPRPAAPAARPGRARRGALDLPPALRPAARRDRAARRLEILRETEDGFRIAEEDLRLRGAGDLIGVQQSGLPRFRIADLETQAELMRMAQDDSRLLLAQDPELAGAARPGGADAALPDGARQGDPNAFRGLAAAPDVPVPFATILDSRGRSGNINRT